MKKFGLIGGTSWHSTVEYYATINQIINDTYGDNTNPPLRLVSLNQKQIHDYQRSDDWIGIAEMFKDAAFELRDIGVEGIALCANTPHKIFDQLHGLLDISIVHISDAFASSLSRSGFDTVGLVGTRFTMEENFITGRLFERHQVKTITPPASAWKEIQDRIYNELSLGVFDDNVKNFFLEIIHSLAEQGAQSVILGCTEIPLLLKYLPCPIPLLDSVKSHCDAIASFILDDGPQNS